METIKVYAVAELKEAHPKGYDRAFRAWQNMDTETPWIEEIWDSLRACSKAFGFEYRDFRADYGFNRFRFENEDVGQLRGKRALAWIENNVIWHWPFCKVALRKGKSYWKPGFRRDCPWTGYFMDDVLIDEIIKSVRLGSRLEDACQGIESVIIRQIEAEIEYNTSEECFLESCEDMFTASGISI